MNKTMKSGLFAATTLAGLLAGLLAATPLLAAVPGTIAVQGALFAKGGGPVSDGDYDLTFALHGAKTAGTALWSEKIKLTVAKGEFWHALGSVTPFPAGVFEAKTGLWLGVQVGAEEEMPRKIVHTAAYARRAAIAEGLACTGCVSLSALKADGDLDLSGHAITVDKVTSKTAVSESIATKALTVDGAKITGHNVPVGSCSTKGEVVKGIDAAGKMICVKAMDPSALPPDGLNEISNGLLSNQFVDSIGSLKAVPIPDHTGVGVTDKLTIGDIGIAQGLDVLVEIANSDITTVTVSVTDPEGKVHVLHDKSGKKGDPLKGTWPSVDKLVSGDLDAWKGKNAKGVWTLKVVDLGELNNKQDGEITHWSVRVQTLSNKKVQANGTLLATAGLTFQTRDTDPVKCDGTTLGYAYYNTLSRTLLICNGTEFDLAVRAPLGSENKPAPTCAAIASAGDAKGTGVYWLDRDGTGGKSPTFQAWCDFGRAGGGWMLAFNLDTNDPVMRDRSDTTFWLDGGKDFGDVTAPLAQDFKSNAGYQNMPVNEILIWAHTEGSNYAGKDVWARYTIVGAHKGKTWKELLALGNNTTIATASQNTGNIAKNAYTRNAGDVFIDHGLPMIVNSTGNGTGDAQNFVRIGTDFDSLCSSTKIDCNGHNVQGGYGGYHIRANAGGYPLTYEAMPNFGYHPGSMGFGDNFVNNNGCGNSVWSNKCGPETARLQVDFAIYVR